MIKIRFINCCFIFFLFGSVDLFSQEIPADYKLLCSIDRPKDMKFGIPGDVLFDSSYTYMAIAYDYNPTKIDLYVIDSLKFIGRFKVKSHVYFHFSYFHLPDTSLYVQYGYSLSKFKKINFKTLVDSYVDCNNTPRKCLLREDKSATKEELPFDKYNKETGVTVVYNYGDNYIFKFDKNKTEIYLKRP